MAPARCISRSIARCARRFSRAGWRRAHGCRRRARSPPTSASRATSPCSPTSNCSARATRKRAPGSGTIVAPTLPGRMARRARRRQLHSAAPPPRVAGAPGARRRAARSTSRAARACTGICAARSCRTTSASGGRPSATSRTRCGADCSAAAPAARAARDLDYGPPEGRARVARGARRAAAAASRHRDDAAADRRRQRVATGARPRRRACWSIRAIAC